MTPSRIWHAALAIALVAGSLLISGHGFDLAAQEACPVERAAPGARVLVFSRTAEFRHTSIPTGVNAIRALGERHGFEVEHTEDPNEFRDDRLDEFGAVVFMSTTGDVLDPSQEAAFERFVQRGGGFVGVHAAADTEYDWEWYGRLVGAYFQRHPPTQPATVVVADTTHLSTRCLPTLWTRTDEWYDYTTQPTEGVSILATLDEDTYRGGEMGTPHPISWYHEFDGGRAWYTGLGHTDEGYAEPAFLHHLAGGILWALGR